MLTLQFRNIQIPHNDAIFPLIIRTLMTKQMIITDYVRSVLNCFGTVWYIEGHKTFTERLKSQLSRDLSLSEYSGS